MLHIREHVKEVLDRAEVWLTSVVGLLEKKNPYGPASNLQTCSETMVMDPEVMECSSCGARSPSRRPRILPLIENPLCMKPGLNVAVYRRPADLAEGKWEGCVNNGTLWLLRGLVDVFQRR